MLVAAGVLWVTLGTFVGWANGLVIGAGIPIGVEVCWDVA